MLNYLNFFFNKNLRIYLKHFKVIIKKKIKKFIITSTIFSYKITKKKFFKSIKTFFFFKKNPAFKRVKKRYFYFKKLKILFKIKNYKFSFTKKKDLLFRRKKKRLSFFRRKKKRFIFIKQNKLFLNKKGKFLTFLMTIFEKKFVNNKFFFKKTNLINSWINNKYYGVDTIFRFFFRFSNEKFKNLKNNNMIYINIIKKNYKTFKKNLMLGVGDRISLVISNSILLFRFVKVFKSLFFSKKYKYIFKKRLRNKFRRINRFKNRNFFDFLFFFYKNVEFSNFNNNIFYIYNMNFLFFNFFLKRYLNIFSWRLYNWSRILKYRR